MKRKTACLITTPGSTKKQIWVQFWFAVGGHSRRFSKDSWIKVPHVGVPQCVALRNAIRIHWRLARNLGVLAHDSPGCGLHLNSLLSHICVADSSVRK